MIVGISLEENAGRNRLNADIDVIDNKLRIDINADESITLEKSDIEELIKFLEVFVGKR